MTKKPKARRLEALLRLMLGLIIILNAMVPTVALAKPNLENSLPDRLTTPRRLPVQYPVYYEPQPLPSRVAQTEMEDQEPLVPKKDNIEFTISTEKAKVEGNRTITINVFIRNHSKSTI